MKIIQVLPTISFGDAVSNDAIAIKNVLREENYKTEIYAENIDGRLPSKTALSIDKLNSLNEEDIIIYHASIGTDLNYRLENYGGKLMMIYHNVTPPTFFHAYSPSAEKLAQSGLDGMKYLSDKVLYCMADSNFNRQNLIDMGYSCKIDVRPILIPFKDYLKKPEQSVINKYQNDGWINIVFVGRLAPNKKQEDIVRSFYYYKKYINPKARLILIGSDSGMENYSKRLKDYIKVLGVEDVIFPGHVTFAEILAYYRIADIFLCMSEHEGFCIPLVEAMSFKVPIIAFDSSAIGDTLGGSGILTNSKDPVFIARLMERCNEDKELRKAVIEGQSSRLKDFSYEKVRSLFLNCLNDFVNRK